MSLKSVSEVSDFEFENGGYDVRQWEVRTRADDEEVGTVTDILVDDGGSVRYLAVDLGLLKKRVLLPIGHARTDPADEVVWVAGMTQDQFERIPEWEATRRIDAQFENELNKAYGDAYDGDRYYERPEFTAGWESGRPGQRPPGRERTAFAAGAAGAATGAAAGSSAERKSITDARLRRLSELHDYEVAKHDPDPRGWQVSASDGRDIGRVDELVVDPTAMKARYLEVDVDPAARGAKGGERRVLVPVGYARLDTDRHRVVLDSFRADDVMGIPHHTETIDRSHEENVRSHLDRNFEGENRYSHPRYSSDRFYTPRGTPRDERR